MKRILFLITVVISTLVFTGCDEDKCLDAPDCGTYGNCNPETGLCECDAVHIGEDCSVCNQSACAGTCNPVTGECECADNFTGIACDECEDGWVGANCDIEACAVGDCGNNGTCNTTTGLCDCNDGWTGENCDILACVDGNCGNGDCNAETGFCDCNEGWSGPNCDCANGTYNETTESCDCNDGWSGADCNTEVNSMVGSWTSQAVCGDNTLIYVSTITEGADTNSLDITNLGGFDENSITSVLITTDSTFELPTTIYYLTDNYGMQIEVQVTGTGTLNATGDQITFEYNADYGVDYITCTDVWDLNP